jgi:hypothetical protein
MGYFSKHTGDVTGLTKEAVAQLSTAMSDAITLMQEEKAKNTETIADPQEAQAAVAQSLTVLEGFY